ncbi:class I SAM-dependent methyltransferase [Pseudomonas cavernae]|uniref:Class I SAM-dependent methyltransferase n=1 Tax=Pseudomonas cavernae TaxID=2320867 RepID=A0A385Z032_9PSED|nr:class I SAM-dependent methyltransferase [Pseudomonas cavernae]AYC31238.1 class I SAM-dependent methyltransferase [Pseudomonas cavernae]
MTDTRQLFTRQSAAYRSFRPTYEAQLFALLAAQAPGRELAWDCACGSGQATLGLAAQFRQVVATDVSQAQLDQAPPLDNVSYRCEPGERSSLAAASVDLTLVAQALHWFHVEAFYAEVRRVSRPGALLAVLSYNRLEIEPAIDALVDHLYHEIVGPYWAPGRKHVEDGYARLPFPFRRLEVPVFGLQAQWDLEHLLGYLQSWSAVADFRAAEGVDPVERLRAQFVSVWGDPGQLRAVSWPLMVKLGVVE